jgi:hypothetical protein
MNDKATDPTEVGDLWDREGHSRNLGYQHQTAAEMSATQERPSTIRVDAVQVENKLEVRGSHINKGEVVAVISSR